MNINNRLEASLPHLAQADRTRYPLHGPLVSGPIQPLVLPPLPAVISAAQIVQCLRFMVAHGRQPRPSDFFQQNKPRTIIRNTVRFIAVSALVFGATLGFTGIISASGFISGESAIFSSAIAGLLTAVLNTKRLSKIKSIARKNNRAQWGFTEETKEADMLALTGIVEESIVLFSGLSNKIAERHRWTFDVTSTDGKKRAAAYVTRALTTEYDFLLLDQEQPIDQGNIQRYRDTGFAILTATNHDVNTKS